MARVRLRSRPRAPLGEGWVLPIAAGTTTPIGNLDSGVGAGVDPAGRVTLDGLRWSLDWWVGAEDRWHVPSREAAVRQTLVGQSPVVETRVRVPSGDAVHRAYAARGAAGEDLVVVEVHNDSRVPFALALALRPFDADGEGHLARVALEGTTVSVDGRPSLALPRSPGRVALSTRRAGDAAEIVFAGTAEAVAPRSVECPDGGATAALLFPVAHTATVRVVLAGPGSSLVAPDVAPASSQVAAGWAAQSRAGARIEVPERRLREAVAACTRFLLLGADGPDDAGALDLLGFHDVAARLLAAEGTEPGRRPGRWLSALARHWALAPDPAFAATVVRVVAARVRALSRTEPADRAEGRAALATVARLLDAAGEPAGAADARALAEPMADGGADHASELARLVAAASSTWTWPRDDGSPAALITALRSILVDDRDDHLALAPSVPEGWLGQGWELHDAPTTHGRLSYAIRWHGERPALLWELEPAHDRPVPRISVPGLDPAWSSTDGRGEALLAPVPVPRREPRRRGLSIPVTIEPRRGGGR